MLPVSPNNWRVLKGSIPGLADAARGLQTAVFDIKKVVVLEIKANHTDSMHILSEHGLRPISYQNVLFAVTRDKRLLSRLKGKWFWIEGTGPGGIGGYFTIQDDLTLERGKGGGPGARERNIYYNKQSFDDYQPNPLSFAVCTDEAAGNANYEGRRFDLHANIHFSELAPVVVGIKR